MKVLRCENMVAMMDEWCHWARFPYMVMDINMLVSRPTVLEHMPLESLQHENVLSDILLRATLIHHKDVLSPIHLRDEVYAEFHHFDKVAGVKV